MELFTLKLITRSWWRNKIFFFISLLSLSIGLACTNLLLTFFIYEYNIESNLPDKEQIVCLQQDAPMQEGAKVSYAVGTIPALLKDKFAEIEEYVRINTMSAQYCKYNTEVFHDVTFICADASLLCFFDYQTRTGNLKEVLIHPDQVAISEEFAQKMFGDTNPIDKYIDVSMSDNGNKTYVVKAVIKARPQSLLRFDLITGTESTFWGGFTLLKLTEGSSPQSLADKINNKSIPTLLPGEGRYYLKPFSEIYFSTSGKTSQESLSYIRQSNVQLLYICLLSAFLIFAMSCFNYTNMNLSRTLQQLKMIHIEKLMGNTLTGIRKQLFGDIFLTVFFAFILSLLFISDILPYFNGLLDAHLHISFFFSTQVLPWLLLFILITAIAPGAYISHKLSRISLNEYKNRYMGKSKRILIAWLMCLQLVISIGLLFATLTANAQINILKNQAYCYENKIEIKMPHKHPAKPLQQELQRNVKGIESMTLSEGSVLNSWIRQLPIKQDDGSESKSYLLALYTDTDFIETMDIKQLAGIPPENSKKQYTYSAVVNESYVKHMIPPGVSPIGHALTEFDSYADSLYIIGGIVKDFPTNSLKDKIVPAIIYFVPDKQLARASYLQLKIKPENRKETLSAIRQGWGKINGGEVFDYQDMHQVFMERNKEVLTLSQILMNYSLIGLLLVSFGLFGIFWYTVRQRIREISIRKIHGATFHQVIWLFSKPFFLQIGISYILAIPVAYWLMKTWKEQFAYSAGWSLWIFLLPLFIVVGISMIVISLHCYLAVKLNPTVTMKKE